MYRLPEPTWLAASAIGQRTLGEVGSVPKATSRRREQGKRDEARDLLPPVYDWFTDGFARSPVRRWMSTNRSPLPSDYRLWTLPNVLLTPRMAGTPLPQRPVVPEHSGQLPGFRQRTRIAQCGGQVVLVLRRSREARMVQGPFPGYNCSPGVGQCSALGCDDIISRTLLEIIGRLQPVGGGEPRQCRSLSIPPNGDCLGTACLQRGACVPGGR